MKFTAEHKEIDLDKFKHLLLQRRHQLESVSEVSEDSAKTVELDQTRVGRLSRMDALQSQAIALESKRRRDRELLKIASALERITAGEYGFCAECGEQILIKRLEVDPTATKCIQCASKSENIR